jgi:uncharacterized repeat protein (TIGR02543 family)
MGESVFENCASGFKVYYLAGTTGFTNPWHGYTTEPFGEVTYTVTYNGNGSTGGTAPIDSKTYLVNKEVTVMGNDGSLVRTGHTFAGWNTKADGTGASYAVGAIFGMGTENIVLYAKWIINSYTVRFNVDGGSAIEDQIVNYNENITKPTDPIKTGYTFGGWYTDSSLATAFDFNEAITVDTTIYAKWIIVNSTPLIVLDKSSLTIEVGKTAELNATLQHINSSDFITFTSSDPTIASVDSITGVVTGNKEGKVIITAKAGELTTTCTVTVVIDECFIATAAFGTKFEPSVVMLRQFRDDYLLTNKLGARFVKIYYSNSPPIANFIAHNEALRFVVRILLLPLITIAYGVLHPLVGIPLLALILALSALLLRKIIAKIN